MKNKDIKIVLWDYGGVLTESPFKNITEFERKNNLPKNTIVNINSRNPYDNAWARLEKNQITIKEFVMQYKKEAAFFGIKNIEPYELLKCMFVSNNSKMVDLLKLVSTKYSCSCLTNNFDLKDISNNFSKSKNIISCFDHVFESSKIFLRKPEKEIYIYVLSRLNVKPSEILFIDDLGINLKPARDIGFVTYKMVEDEKCVEYIKNLLYL